MCLLRIILSQSRGRTPGLASYYLKAMADRIPAEVDSSGHELPALVDSSDDEKAPATLVDSSEDESSSDDEIEIAMLQRNTFVLRLIWSHWAAVSGVRVRGEGSRVWICIHASSA